MIDFSKIQLMNTVDKTPLTNQQGQLATAMSEITMALFSTMPQTIRDMKETEELIEKIQNPCELTAAEKSKIETAVLRLNWFIPVKRQIIDALDEPKSEKSMTKKKE
jgi:hypothetical protein